MNELHLELFPEEYDFMYDSIADARDRARGKNPMSQSYIDEVNERRINMGVKPYETTKSSPEHHKQALTDPTLIDSHVYVEQIKNK